MSTAPPATASPGTGSPAAVITAPPPQAPAAAGGPVVVAGVVGVVTVISVVVVAVIAAVVSYSHMQQLAARAGEAWRSWLIPLSIDGLVVAASMVLLTRRRTGLPGGVLAWATLGGGVLASLAANMADARPGLTAVLVAGWPAAAFAAGFELLLQQRRPTTPPDPGAGTLPALTAVSAPGLAPVGSTPPVGPAPGAQEKAVPSAAGSPPPARHQPSGAGPVAERVRELIARTGGVPGRRSVARELGVTEYQARRALELVTTGPGALNDEGR